MDNPINPGIGSATVSPAKLICEIVASKISSTQWALPIDNENALSICVMASDTFDAAKLNCWIARHTAAIPRDNALPCEMLLSYLFGMVIESFFICITQFVLSVSSRSI